MNKQLRWNCRAAGLIIPVECPVLHCATVPGQVLQIVCVFSHQIFHTITIIGFTIIRFQIVCRISACKANHFGTAHVSKFRPSQEENCRGAMNCTPWDCWVCSGMQ